MLPQIWGIYGNVQQDNKSNPFTATRIGLFQKSTLTSLGSTLDFIYSCTHGYVRPNCACILNGLICVAPVTRITKGLLQKLRAKLLTWVILVPLYFLDWKKNDFGHDDGLFSQIGAGQSVVRVSMQMRGAWEMSSIRISYGVTVYLDFCFGIKQNPSVFFF